MKILPKWDNYNITKGYYLEAIEQEINGIIKCNIKSIKIILNIWIIMN